MLCRTIPFRRAAIVVVGLVCGMVLAGAAHAQKRGDDPAALNAEVRRLYEEGKYAEATEVAKRLLTIAEKRLGPSDVGTVLDGLARLYEKQRRFRDAESLYKRSIEILERALGPGHPDVSASRNRQAALLTQQGRFAEAEPLLKSGLAILEKARGREHLDVVTALNDLALLYLLQKRYSEAEPSPDWWESEVALSPA